MQRATERTLILASVMFLLFGLTSRVIAERPVASPPDLTQGGVPDDDHDWLLGPTGARGWIFARDEDLTGASRQILVTAVENGSPAAEVLRPGDVILGVNDRPFTADARRSFGYAIGEAEGSTGILRLIRWREGQRTNVFIKLAALGAYTATAPYDCPKSQKIAEAGCRYIASKGLKGISIETDLEALALLASERQEYRPMLAEYAKRVAEYKTDDFATWLYGYANMFLAEYCMSTGDQSVLPGVRRLALEAARGQSAVGTWGHKFARPDGNLNGYGCMNQPGLSLMISMVLARKAGAYDPALDRAITKGSGFLRWYVDKGAIPYGDHRPGRDVHEDNGKTSSGAVLFDLLGDREAATFYAKMATAAYDDREHGHTGIVWNAIWAMPAVSRCGPLATGAYFKEQSWYYDLARNWKGGFEYQAQPGRGGNDDDYKHWDCTGAYVLAYEVPLRSLYLTGKKVSTVPPLSRTEVQDVIAAGRDVYPVNGIDGYDQRTTAQLLAGLSSWSPVMRYRSAQALSRRKTDSSSILLRMLASPDRDTRYGACEALGYQGSRADASAPRLRALLHDSDPWMVCLACDALTHFSPEVRKQSVNDLLILAVRKNPADPREMIQREVAHALFEDYPGSRDPRAILDREPLVGIDRRLLDPAIESLLQNQDGATRFALKRVYNELSDRDLAIVMPSMVQAIEKLAPSDEMFADEIRLAGLDVLSRLHIREGMPLCVSVIEMDRWNESGRLKPCLEYLLRYGVHAKEVLPQLRAAFAKTHDFEMKRFQPTFDKAISDIESSTDSPTLITMQQFIQKASTGATDSRNVN